MTALSRAEFGQGVLEAIVTPERAAAVVADVVGPQVRFGPVRTGRGGIATATAVGDVGEIVGRRHDADVLLEIPVLLAIDVCIGDRTVPVPAEVTVPLRLRAGLVRPLAIAIEVDPVEPADVDVRSEVRGVAGVLLRRFGNLDDEIRRHVATFVQDVVDGEAGREARRIDLLVIINYAWDAGLQALRGPGRRAAS